MGIWNKVFEARESKKHTFIELTEEIWNDIYSCSWNAYTLDTYHLIAVKHDDKKAFWIEVSEIHHDDYAIDKGLLGVDIGNFIELGDNGLILWSKEKFKEKFIRE